MSIPLETILTTGVRAGNTVERAGKMHEQEVCLEAIAAQMSHNSKNKIKYNVADVVTLIKVYEDCKSRVLITSTQARSLIDDASGSATCPLLTPEL